MLVFLLIAALTAQANDGAYYVSGNQLVPLQETDISIRKEVLTIYLQDGAFARVDVYYEFWNPGTTEKHLLMGFEAGPLYNESGLFQPELGHPNINGFTVEMNGQRLNIKNAPYLPNHQLDPKKRYYVHYESGMLYEESNWDVDNDEPKDWEAGIEFSYVYSFDAVFKPGLNVVHHTYSYRMSELNTLPFLLSYNLTPAARWAGGTIGDFSLVVRAEKTAKHFAIPEPVIPGAEIKVTEGFGKTRTFKAKNYYTNDYGGDEVQWCEVALRNGAVCFHKKDFHPEEELFIEGMGAWGDTLGSSYDRSSEVFLWYYESVYLEDAQGKEKEFLMRVMHNLPYAHRGRVFKDRKLQEYFESLWWYMPDPNYKDDTSDFTEVDWKFVRAKFEE